MNVQEHKDITKQEHKDITKQEQKDITKLAQQWAPTKKQKTKSKSNDTYTSSYSGYC